MIALALIALQGQVLTLADAVQAAESRQPQIRQARAQTEAAWARADEARSAILPQLTGTAQYTLQTANFVPRPGLLPSNVTVSSPAPTFNLFNFYSLGLQLNQWIWDFTTLEKWKASRATAESQAASERTARETVRLTVRAAFFTARANRALVDVARQNLENIDRHRKQVVGMVEVGARPEIDRLQAETDYANAQVQLITAENNYETAKAQLNQAMGIARDTAYDVSDEALPPVDGEDLALDPLVDEAVKGRPELAAFARQLHAQELTISAAKGGYWPSFAGQMNLTDQGTHLDGLVWNWNVNVLASWPLFQGLLTQSTVKEAHANLRSLESQRDAELLQVRLDVDQARLAVRAGKATIAAAETALQNARARLDLAEQRYTEGLGNAIELGDAQVALATTAAQRVQAEFNLAVARAQLTKALGRDR